jgi:acetyl-CoA acetyltransferase
VAADWPVRWPTLANHADRSSGLRRTGHPTDVGVVSLHDMCASEQITALIALELAATEEVAELAQSCGLASGGGLPTNTDGGCLARGHAFGATGLAQVAEVVSQLRGEADRGSSQIRGSGWHRRWAAADPASSPCWAR